MNDMLALAKRNVLCYFRDRSSVFFSLMSVIIVILLYLLFLRDMLISANPPINGMDRLVDAWVLSGILGIIPVTTCAGALQTMVEDRVNGRDRDVLVTPMKASAIAGGYIISTFIVGMAMSAIALVLSVAYLGMTGCPLSVAGVLTTVVLMIPSALSGSIIMYAITSRLRSTGAFSGLFVTMSVLIGFLAGIYMPMGTMPEGMQIVGMLVPASHMASLFRQSLAGEALNDVFSGAPSEMVESFRTDMGFDISLMGFELDPFTSMVFVLAVTALFFIIAVMGIRRR